MYSNNLPYEWKAVHNDDVEKCLDDKHVLNKNEKLSW